MEDRWLKRKRVRVHRRGSGRERKRESLMEGTCEIIYAANTSYQCGLEMFYGNMPSPVLSECGFLEGGEQKAVAGS